MYKILANYDFIIRSWLIGVLLSLVAGPLGSLMLWRRMSTFADTLAHSSLLGIALAVVLNINFYLGLLLMGIFCAGLLLYFLAKNIIASDTILSILAQTSLALGLIIITSLDNLRLDLLSYLYGDILSVSMFDLYVLLILVLMLGLYLWFFWPKLIFTTIHEDLAKIANLNVKLLNYSFIMSLVLIFAVSIKIIGVLLQTALFILPAAAARALSTSPGSMALLASLFSMLAVSLGLCSSLYFDLPAGPAIVVIAGIIFSISFIFKTNAK